MKYPVMKRFNIRLPALGLLAATLFLLGCEGGNNGASAPVQPSQAATQATMPGQDTAIEMLKIRLFDDPENGDLLAKLGDAYFEQRRFGEAIPIYERAVLFNPKNHDALNDLGLSYHYTGNTEAALNALDRSATAKPDYKFARLSKGYILLSLGRYDEAEAPLRKAQELDPNGGVGKEAGRMLMQVEEMRAAK